MRGARSDARSFASGLPARLGFVVLAFGPLLFAPVLSPAMLLAVAPLAEVLLSRMPTTFTMGTHYAGAWIGYVLVAFALALRASRGRACASCWGCIALCVVEFLVADPLHPGLNLRAVEARDVALDHFLHDAAGGRRSRDARGSLHASRADRSERAPLAGVFRACRRAHVSYCSIVTSPIPRACKSTAARSRAWLTSGATCSSRAAAASSCIAAPAAVA